MAQARILVSDFYFCLSFRQIPDKHEVYDELGFGRNFYYTETFLSRKKEEGKVY